MSDETKTMRLPVALNDDEVQARAHEAAELMLELDTAEEQEADRKKAWKQDFETRKRKLRALSAAVRERAEHRMVEVDEVPCVGRATMEIYRRDTGESVYSRPMTDSEQRLAAQSSLWDEKATATVRTTVGKAESVQ